MTTDNTILTDLQALSIKQKVEPRPLSVIAKEIAQDWSAAKGGIYFGAKPYIVAMRNLNSINDIYILDSGKSVVSYFLSNASTWKGPIAKRIKLELKQLLKG